MIKKDSRPYKEYEGVVLFDDEPGIPFRLKARDVIEAKMFAKMTDGDHDILLTRERDIRPYDPYRLKEYKGIVWIDDQPGKRFTIQASCARDAGDLARATFGDYPMTIRNEEDAHELR